MFSEAKKNVRSHRCRDNNSKICVAFVTHTFCFCIRVVLARVEGEVELTSEHLSVVHVDEIINILLDHIRLTTARERGGGHNVNEKQWKMREKTKLKGGGSHATPPMDASCS